MSPIPQDPLTKMTEPEAMAPVQVVMVGGTGDGATEKVTAVTPEGHPNVILTVVTPFAAIAVRFIYLYLTILSGLVAAGLADKTAIPSADFGDLVWRCAGLSIAGAGVGLLKDLVTIFGKLESKFPLLTGSV